MVCGLVLLLLTVVLLVREIRDKPPAHDAPPVAEQRVGMTGGEFTPMSATDSVTTFRATVTSVGTGIERLEGRDGPLTPDGQFVVVHLTVKNTTRSPTTVGVGGFDLVDTDGGVAAPHSEATRGAMALNDLPVGGDLELGQTRSYINVYEVASSARPAEIVMEDADLFGGSTIDITG
ncbi:uncharacterized protein DUF4352 [Nocardiopsis sp. Huas11]|uniref:DUF4352 domain-containing protein n=1 Tax=Nocardiopsis sp. Huas11 TaxID=2183912 RepID=UPI000F1630F6|nr:DUF4352 domain-containing protein [Nocardiopsis sp. Huas11]RKS05420.1 uncharacterized protein DUF4352 [Nocardiopsis sp. Huas11]